MSTSWWDNWVFSSGGVNIYWRKCNHNYPRLRELQPHKNLTLDAILEICDSTNFRVKQGLKLGFIHVNEKEYDCINVEKDFFDILSTKKRNNDIIWSNNSIFLDR